MNKFYILVFVLLLFSACSCFTATTSKKDSNQTELKQSEPMSNQKNNGIENIKIIPKTQINLVQDEWGQYYIKLLPGDKTVFSYSFKKSPKDTNLKDARYGQKILFEWQGDLKEMELYDTGLKKVNLVMSYFGFRNENTQAVDKGFLKIKRLDDKTFQIHIKINQDIPKPFVQEIQTKIQIDKK